MHESTAAPRLKILLIDDDELIAGALRSYLASAGCDVDLASDRAGAEKLMARHQYATVFVDPYLTTSTADDRLMLLDTVRQLQPSASLIVATAYATPAITESLSAGRISTLFIKPRPIAELGRAAFAKSTLVP
ncbi:MAG TPA: response regulator [Thermoanaerobaculia bacterium]|nr:response regulator [Thermoanaerobaculia bacterium]